MLTIAGLGPGDAEALPVRTFSLLTQNGLPLLLRTARHPTVTHGSLADALAKRPATEVVALDDEYESNASFADTYEAIVARVLRAHDVHGDIVYAVPGHPLVGETTVALLLARLKETGTPFQIVAAPSFVDACLALLGESITGDLHIVDALSLTPDAATVSPALRSGGNAPVLLYQVHSRAAASQAKLALMQAGYPDDWQVTILHAAGVPGEEKHFNCDLHELDRRHPHNHLTSVWVPPLPEEKRKITFPNLVDVLARLRDPNGGCPWDLKQTHATLRRYLLEEAYEAADAIDEDDPDKLCDELGDVLLQVVFHAQLAREAGFFDADDVCRAIVEKMIRRHPHVFGNVKADTPEEVLTNWQAIKATEKGHESRSSVLDGIPQSLPALAQAMEISKRAVKAGFEWETTQDVLDKVDEEIAELKAELNGSPERIESELGDVLFTLVNVARRTGLDAETALRKQLARFTRRFQYLEIRATEIGQPLDSLSLAEMERFWHEAKALEKE